MKVYDLMAGALSGSHRCRKPAEPGKGRDLRADRGPTIGIDRLHALALAGKAPLTWITPRIMASYTEAFHAGHAHSFEVWNADGDLVGGGYGLAFGRMFSTESQFSFEPNTSKIGFTLLHWHLAHWGFVLNDGKRFTPTIDGMGFRAIPRDEFTGLCERYGREPLRIGRWSAEADLATVSSWKPEAERQSAAA